MYRKDSKREQGLNKRVFFSKSRKICKIYSVFYILLFISGCASIPIPKVETVNIDLFPPLQSADNTDIFPSSVDSTVPDIDILGINQDIKEQLDDIKNIRDLQKRLQKLTELVTEKVVYDTIYDIYGVKTAQETFDTGTGNCLSFSNLFIAAARYSGLNAWFSEIPTLPYWTRDGEIIFTTRHIGAYVDIRNILNHVIQLENQSNALIWDDSVRYYITPALTGVGGLNENPFNHRTITDRRAFAQHYNNLGCKYLADGKREEAFRYFVKAIKTDPELSFAWSNLGALYRKNKQFKAAEKAYFQGLAVVRGPKDASTLTIIGNLANLYTVTGEKEKASLYGARVASFREKNPYYKYEMGKSALSNEDFDKSIGLFKEAISLKEDEHLFYYSLALSYYETGDLKKAMKNISNAIKYSWNKNRKDYYKKVYNLFADGKNM